MHFQDCALSFTGNGMENRLFVTPKIGRLFVFNKCQVMVIEI